MSQRRCMVIIYIFLNNNPKQLIRADICLSENLQHQNRQLELFYGGQLGVLFKAQ